MSMASIDCRFETARLRVSRWPSEEDGSESFDLPSWVAGLLTAKVTEPLPDAWRGLYSRGRAEAWIRDRDLEGTTLLVEDRAASRPIGLVLLHDSPDPESPRSDLRVGYLLAETHWGRGYATELLQGLVEWAKTSPYRGIVAGVSSTNTASKRVLEKCGFAMVGGAGSEEFYFVEL